MLAQSHRVICADLRGHGWTGAPPYGYAKESLATDAIALLDALDIERVGLMGHDWGGYIGFLLCLRAPERIERLLALNTGHPLSNPSPGRAFGLRSRSRAWPTSSSTRCPSSWPSGPPGSSRSGGAQPERWSGEHRSRSP